MPANPTTAKQFLLNTDYPIDKIVGIQSGSMVVGTFSFEDAIIPHNLGFAPLTKAKWSTSANFDTSYDVTSQLAPLTAAAQVYSDATNLIVRAVNFTSTGAVLFYKVFYLMPSGVDAEVPFTQQAVDNFTFNTEFNYTKLLDSGVVEGSSGSVNHNLGYRPQCEVWWEDSGGFIRPVVDYLQGDQPYATISTTALNFVADPFNNPVRWHYRIYAEEL